MRALLEIHGWRKIQEVPDRSCISGHVRIAVQPPISLLMRPEQLVTDRYATSVDLFMAGDVNKMPFFKVLD